MRHIFALAISLAVFVAPWAVPPGLANATPGSSQANSQQAIDHVIQRGLSQRGVPFVYGGGGATGPSQGVRQEAATVPGTGAFPGTATVPGTATAPGTAAVPGAGTFPGTTTAPGTTFPGTSSAPSTSTFPGTATVPGAGTVGFDASGLMVYSFAGVGLKLPRSSGEQYATGRKVAPAQARRGDLIFYGPNGSQSVALFLGNNQMLEVGDVVQVSPVRAADMTPYLVRVIQ